MAYAITVSDSFVARHALTVPDAGPEGELHTHQYAVDATFRGDELDERAYLLDVDEATAALTSVLDRYRDATLNECLPGNPSCERLATAIHDDLRRSVDARAVERLEVAVQEDDVAVVSYVGSV